MMYYTLEYRDTRNNTRTKRYFREKYLLDEYINKNEYCMGGAKLGTEKL